MAEPIKPENVEKKLPDEVIEVFNDLINQYWDGTRACVRQHEAAKLVAERMNVKVGILFEKKYMDVEDVYRKAGWNVVYDKPGFNESYEPFFVFSHK